jgi:predicted ATPase/DNA-binding SARP family transcriptional activator
MTQLRFFVLGPPRLERTGRPVELGLRKAVALCVYLLVARQPQSRDALATLFWPDQDQREARASLRRTLHRLTQAIGAAMLTTDADMVAISPTADLWVDAVAFERLAADDPAAAVALYGDDFLAGFTLPDSPAFDEWQFFERERLRQRLAELLEGQIAAAQACGDWTTAADYARRWVALDVLHEPAQRALLMAYAQSGQAAAAQRQYQELERVLELELGAEPEAETRALYETIRSRRLTPAPLAVAAPAPASDPAPPHLPLIGRERELAELLDLLVNPAGPRLITLIGPGGIGKTHLAQALAGAAAGRFAHGAHLIFLAELADPAAIVPTIAMHLGLRVTADDAGTQLQRMLRERELLLVLDNFEHLIAGAPALTAILAAPGVRILVTSRERLGISGELVYSLGGLALPDEGGVEAVLDAPAARLFLQQARLVRHDLAPDHAECAAIARLCRLVDGMPLALTLAAGWAELLTFDAIADEIARSLDFLATEQHDVPARQRSVSAVFGGSWQRLPAGDQQILTQLTAFRGGFSRPAAEAVAGADLRALRRLVSNSFITVDARAERYAIHELLRQYIAEQTDTPATLAAARERQSGYYLDLLRELSGDLRSPRQQAAITAIAADFENIQAAWEWAATHGHDALLAGAATGLWIFCDRRSRWREARRLFAPAAAAVRDEGQALQGFLLAGEGYFTARCTPQAAGWELMERGIALLRRAAAPQELWLPLALLHMALAAHTQGRFADAERIAEESLAIFADIEDRWGVTYSLLLLGLAVAYKGRPVLASQLLRASHEHARAIGEQGVASLAASSLAIGLTMFGDYPQARRYLDLALQDAEAIGDPMSAAIALHERGMLALTCGDTTLAASAFQASAEAFAATGSQPTAAMAEQTRELAAMLRGDPEGSAAVEQRALAAIQSAGEQTAARRYCELAGRLAARRGELAQAEHFDRAALSFAQRQNQEPAIAAAAAQLAETLVARAGATNEVRHLLALALELALRHQLAPVALQAALTAVRAGFADELLARTPDLPALILAHPAATQSSREQARALAAQPEVAQQAAPSATGAQIDWRAVAQQLLRALNDNAAAGRAPPTNIDLQLPPLIGRDLELAQLLGLLNMPRQRLVTLHGPGGMGKTRLAQEAGLATLDSFADGVFFVALASVTDPAQIAAAVAEQIGLRLSGAGAPREQLLAHLRERQLLLILDNFEQLLDGAELVTAIRRAAPKVVILVTSRERLGLDGELVSTLSGIAIPESEHDEQAMERGAVQLLLERVRQANPRFTPGPADVDAMIRVCRLVQGMPLAIILAASWANLLTLAEIAAEIAQSLDFLQAELRGLPRRQQSVRAVFDASWRRLQPEAQHAFARMAVFRGGFSRRAAQQVAGASLHTLRDLLNSAFITPGSNDRYAIHELLRQFGAERLAAMGEADALRDRHSRYYLEAIAALEPELKGRGQIAAVESIEHDLENLRHAWYWAVEQHNGDLIGCALDSLFEFAEKRGRFHEGAELLLLARGRLAPRPESGPLWQRFTVRISILRSRFPREAQVPLAELKHACAIAGDSGADADAALANLAIAAYYARTENDYARSLIFAERAYELHCTLGDRYYQAEDLARLGICYGYLGDTQLFYEGCNEGYRIAEADGNQIGMAITLMNLIEALLHLGRYTEMLEHCDRLIAIAESLGLRNGMVAALAYSALGRLLQGDLPEARRLGVLSHRLGSEINSALSAGLSLGVLSLQAVIGGDNDLGVRLAEESLTHPLNLVATVEVYWSLALANCGMGRLSEADHALRTAHAAAAKFATLVPKVWLLPALAVLLAGQGREGDAAAVLALAEAHPLSAPGWMRHWGPLACLRADIERSLGAAGLAAAYERGARLDVAAAFALLQAGEGA